MGRPSDAKEKLIAAAADELWRRSYGSVGVGTLCTAAGVKRGSFYYFFESKDELVLAALEHAWERMRQRFDATLGDTRTPPSSRLSRLFESIAALHEEFRDESGVVPGCPFGNLGVELGAIHPPVQEQVASIFAQARGYLVALLREAGANGTDAQELERRAEQILACLQGAQVLAKTQADPDVIRRMAPVAVGVACGPDESVVKTGA
ncbi:TetR/AcrR family transcriptional regulator [Thiohalorhabdus sp.]|uniref:TetR/AcrR family transcriptional regulator n=1 Tax=Thiohalorhabdus sp. TaxID=3094134 RepID=UPI002FC3C883